MRPGYGREAKIDRALACWAALLDEAEGVPPTVREFQEAMGISGTSLAAYWIMGMVKAGVIKMPAAIRRRTGGYAVNRAYVVTAAGRARLAGIQAESAESQ